MLVVIVLFSGPGMISTLILLFIFLPENTTKALSLSFLLWLNIMKEGREEGERQRLADHCAEDDFQEWWVWVLPTWNASLCGSISLETSVPAHVNRLSGGYVQNKETQGVKTRKRRQSREQKQKGGFYSEALGERKELKGQVHTARGPRFFTITVGEEGEWGMGTCCK